MKGIPAPDDIVESHGTYRGSREKVARKNNFIIFVIFLVAIVAIALYINGLPKANGEEDYIEINTSQNTSGDLGVKNQTVNESSEEFVLGKAISEKNPQLCEQLETLQQDCYEALAGESQEACLKVEDYSKKKECVESLVQESGSAFLCKELEETDQNACGLLVDPCYTTTGEERKLCLAIKNNDYTYCGDTTCFLKYAKETGNTSVCEVLDLPAEQSACDSVAQKQDKCVYLGLVAQKDMCYRLYATIVDSSYYCGQISADSTEAYTCYTYFAVNTGNYTFCANLVDVLNDPDDCYTEYAVKTGDLQGCIEIDKLGSGYTSQREKCYVDYAVGNYKPAVCEKLKYTAQSICYGQSMEGEELPIESCNEMNDGVWKDKCYKESAEKNDNPLYCNSIDDTDLKASCKAMFE